MRMSILKWHCSPVNYNGITIPKVLQICLYKNYVKNE